MMLPRWSATVTRVSARLSIRLALGAGLLALTPSCFSSEDFSECTANDQCRSGICVSGSCTVLDGPDMDLNADAAVDGPDMGDSDTRILSGRFTPTERGVIEEGKTVIIDNLLLEGNAIPLRVKARRIIVRGLNANGAGYLGGGGGGGGAGGSPGMVSFVGGEGGARSGASRGQTGESNNGASAGNGGRGGDGGGIGGGVGGDPGVGGPMATNGLAGRDALYVGEGQDPCFLLPNGTRYIIGSSGGGGGGGAGSNAAECIVGSGGGGGGTGGNGGGAIQLEASEEIIIEGAITATGQPSSQEPPAGAPGGSACELQGETCDGNCLGGNGGEGVDPVLSGAGTQGGAGGIGMGAVNPGGDGGGGGGGAGGTVVLIAGQTIRFEAGASINLSGAGAEANQGSLRIFGAVSGELPPPTTFHLCNSYDD